MMLTNDIKFVSDQLFALWLKLISLLTLNPKFVTEFLRIIYEEKMREYWGEHIYRTIVETEDFALPSEENVGEIHRQIAHQRRQSLADEKQKNPNNAHSHLLDSFRVVELGSHAGLTSGPAGKAMLEEIEKSSNHHSRQMLKALHQLQPMLFEECYVKSFDYIRSRQANEHARNKLSEYDYRGLHLFVMVHGFQGNSNDMRLLKNNIALLFPEVMFLLSSANEEHTEGDIQEMGVRLS